MEVRFQTEELDRLEVDADFDMHLPPEIVRAYRKRIQVIRAASDERDLYAIKSHRFKKLVGSRSHQRSMRLNDQWRLVLEVEQGRPKNIIHVVGIEDYH